jgi:hypothetical protein
LAQNGLQLGKPLLVRILATKARRPLKLCDGWVERAILVVKQIQRFSTDVLPRTLDSSTLLRARRQQLQTFVLKLETQPKRVIC